MGQAREVLLVALCLLLANIAIRCDQRVNRQRRHSPHTVRVFGWEGSKNVLIIAVVAKKNTYVG
jgi:hypothetical protein